MLIASFYFFKKYNLPHLKNTLLQLSIQWSLQWSLQLSLRLSLQLQLQCHLKKFFISISPQISLQCHFNFHLSSQSNINDVVILLQTTADNSWHLFTFQFPLTFHNNNTCVTSPFAKRRFEKSIFCWNILSSCICTIVDVFLPYIVTFVHNTYSGKA